MALPRQHRLKLKKDFDLLRRQGKVVVTPLFLIYRQHSSTPTPFQVGIVISKKITKLAVQRNRWRRQISEVFRRIIQEQGNKLSGLKVIVVARPRLKTASWTEINYWLRKYCGKFAEKNGAN